MKNALVVDDSKTARMVLQRKLENLQINTHLAESGEEALEYLKNNRPDVIFMDVMMEGMNGYEATLAITKTPGCSNIPIIMCTSKDTPEDRLEATKNGAQGYLVKPISDEKFILALESLAHRPAVKPTPPKPAIVEASMQAEIDALVRNMIGKYTLQIVDRTTRQVTQDTLGTQLGVLEEKINVLSTQFAAPVVPSLQQSNALPPEYLKQLEEQVHTQLQHWNTQEQTRRGEYEQQLQHQLQQTAERAVEIVIARSAKPAEVAPATSPITWVTLGLALIAVGLGIVALLH